jgi:hypothetical protein
MSAQSFAALDRANAVRLRRSAFHAELRALAWPDAADRLADTIADMPDWLATIPLETLLGYCPQIGQMRVRQLLGRAKLTRTQRLGDVDIYRRRVLCGLLISWARDTSPRGVKRSWQNVKGAATEGAGS